MSKASSSKIIKSNLRKYKNKVTKPIGDGMKSLSSFVSKVITSIKSSPPYGYLIIALVFISASLSRIRNFNFDKVWLTTSTLSIAIALWAIITGDQSAIGLEFFVVIFLLLQSGKDLDEKYVNSKKFWGVIINFLSMLVVFYSVEYTALGAEVMIFFSFWAIAAYSLNLSTGMVGVLNFGVVAQIAVGAVTFAVLTVNHDVYIPIAIIAAMFMSALFSAVIAFTTLRLSDDYFAIISITLGEILRQIIKTEITLRGPTINGKYPSTAGVLNVPFPFKKEWDFYMRYIDQNIEFDLLEHFTHRFFLGIIGFIFVFLIFIFVTKLIYSPYGRLLKSIREDELVASTYGKDILRYKVEVMALSGAVAGLAGVYATWIFTSIFPENFLPQNTFFIWTIFIIGGRGSNKGIIVGAIAFTLLRQMSLEFNDPDAFLIRALNDFIHNINPNTAPDNITMSYIQLMLVGLILILFIRFSPRGIVPEEAYRPLVGGKELPQPGSESEAQKGIAGVNE